MVSLTLNKLDSTVTDLIELTFGVFLVQDFSVGLESVIWLFAFLIENSEVVPDLRDVGVESHGIDEVLESI